MADAEATVSWQSAFFGLAAIAMNTMTQPAGRVCGFDAASRLYLRSSPIICVVDTIQILTQVVTCFSQGDDLRKVVRHIVDHRFQGIEAGDEDSLHFLLKSTTARWVVFGLSAATQIVKLYALSGIWWTQLLAAIYVFSWTIVETLVLTWEFLGVVPTTSREEYRPPRRRRGRDWDEIMLNKNIGRMAIISQCILTIAAIFVAGKQSFLEDGGNLTSSGQRFIIALIFPWFVLVVPGAMAFSGPLILAGLDALLAKVSISLRGFLSSSVSLTTAYVVCLVVITWSFGTLQFTGDIRTDFGGSMILFCLLMDTLLFLILITILSSWKLNLISILSVDLFWRSGFLLTTFLGGLTFYIASFDRAGTVKPLWTDILG